MAQRVDRANLWRTIQAWLQSFLRYLIVFAIVLVVFGIVLALAGKDPLRAYLDIFNQTLATPYGLSEVVVRMIPLILTAVAVAIPAP